MISAIILVNTEPQFQEQALKSIKIVKVSKKPMRYMAEFRFNR